MIHTASLNGLSDCLKITLQCSTTAKLRADLEERSPGVGPLLFVLLQAL